MRKTKIIVTIGPSSNDEETLSRLISDGMDCARLNFSHGTHDEHATVIERIRRLAKEQNKTVGILQDLGGIKLRLGRLAEARQLNLGDEVVITADDESSTPDILPFPQPGVIRNLQVGSFVFIADGTVQLEVTEITPDRAFCRVLSSGVVSSFKGVNLPGVPIDQPVFTDKDKRDLIFGVEQQVDWVAVSFVRTANDILYARRYLNAAGSKALVMAKLERGEGIENLDSILPEVDSVMVARGDLGVEIPMERVPRVQRLIVDKANAAGKGVVIATQMLRSMVISPTPTRAEVSDVSNAVLEGTDSILLSDETAMGQYPVEALRVAVSTINEAESEDLYPYFKDMGTHDRTQAITSAAAGLVKTLDSKPIVLTSTGRAALELARFRPINDILAFSHDPAVLRKLCLGWGIQPTGVIPVQPDVAELVYQVIQSALDLGAVSENDVVTIVHGFLTGVSGTTNAVQVLSIREYLENVGRRRAEQMVEMPL
ncbi:Pyruvate kinase [Geodia barretti]|uniref:Pyruvate kinase n=2 Tax=Geodia barretti TaxID=519541 RepID=A0AA35WJ47_GEOBA|nr:Pyruvate kinase [Geodia barretti]